MTANPPATATLIASAQPGIYLCQRPGGTWHVLTNVGTCFVMCNTCEAAKHGRDCWAIEIAANESTRLIEEGKSMTAQETTTAIAIAQRSGSVQRATETRLALVEHVASIENLLHVASFHRAAGIIPSGFATDEMAAMALLKALELDVPLTTAYQFFYITNGKVGIMAEMIRALVEAKCAGTGYIHVEKSSPTSATCVGYRDGRKPVSVTFTVEDAKRANIFKGNWLLYPEDHCVAKASARVGRRMFADVLGGMMVVDRGGQVIDSGVPDDDDPGVYGGGTYEVIDVTPTEVPATPATAPVREPEPEKSAPAFWTAMLAKMPTLGLTAGDVAAFMERDFNAREVQSFCTQRGIRPAALLDQVVAAKTPPPVDSNVIDSTATELPFDDDAATTDWFADFEAAMAANNIRPLDVSAHIGKPYGKQEVLDWCMGPTGVSPEELIAALKGGANA